MSASGVRRRVSTTRRLPGLRRRLLRRGSTSLSSKTPSVDVNSSTPTTSKSTETEPKAPSQWVCSDHIKFYRECNKSGTEFKSSELYLKLPETGEQWLKRHYQWLEETVKFKMDQAKEENIKSGYTPWGAQLATYAPSPDFYGFFSKSTDIPTRIQEFQIAVWLIWERSKEKLKGAHGLFAGRDAWLFEVCARVEGLENTTFLPEISTAMSRFLGKGKHPFQNSVFLDTGFRGTCATNMGIKEFFLMNHSVVGQTRQLIKNAHYPFGGFGSLMEASWKYWSSAYIWSEDPVNLYSPKYCQQAFDQAPMCAQAFEVTEMIAGALLNPEIEKRARPIYARICNEEKKA